jgi:hypothetical protein
MKRELDANNIAGINTSRGTTKTLTNTKKKQRNQQNHHLHTHSLFKKQEIRPRLRRYNDNGQHAACATETGAALQQHLQITRGRDVCKT